MGWLPDVTVCILDSKIQIRMESDLLLFFHFYFFTYTKHREVGPKTVVEIFAEIYILRFSEPKNEILEIMFFCQTSDVCTQTSGPILIRIGMWVWIFFRTYFLYHFWITQYFWDTYEIKTQNSELLKISS